MYLVSYLLESPYTFRCCSIAPKHFLQLDETDAKDANRNKLRGTNPVFSLISVGSANDLASIFEVDPTVLQRSDDFVPK